MEFDNPVFVDDYVDDETPLIDQTDVAATLKPPSLPLPKTYGRPQMKRPHGLPVASHQVFLKKILLLRNRQRLS